MNNEFEKYMTADEIDQIVKLAQQDLARRSGDVKAKLMWDLHDTNSKPWFEVNRYIYGVRKDFTADTLHACLKEGVR